MPAGTDIITWSPRVGNSGDDRYDPGDALIKAGNSTFSSRPTVNEVNGATGLNQVIADVNRRSWDNTNYYVYAGLNMAALSYVAAGDRILAQTFNTLKERITNIRTLENQSAYSWGSFWVVAAGQKILQDHLQDLRKALAFDRIFIPPYKIDNKVSGTIYPSLAEHGATVTLNTFGSHTMGYERSGGDPTGYRYRTYVFFNIDGGFPTLGDVKHTFAAQNTHLDGTDYVRIHRSNSYLGPIDTGDWGNLDNLELDLAVSTYLPDGNVYTITASVANPTAFTSNVSLIAGTKSEETAYPGDPLPPGTDKRGEYLYAANAAYPWNNYLELYTA